MVGLNFGVRVNSFPQAVTHLLALMHTDQSAPISQLDWGQLAITVDASPMREFQFAFKISLMVEDRSLIAGSYLNSEERVVAERRSRFEALRPFQRFA